MHHSRFAHSHRESGKMSLAEAPRPRIPSLCTIDGLSRSCLVPNTSRSPRQSFVRVGTFSGVGVCKSSRLFGLQEHRMHAPSRVQDKKHRKKKRIPQNSLFQTNLLVSGWNKKNRKASLERCIDSVCCSDCIAKSIAFLHHVHRY